MTNSKSGILMWDISDHFPVFLIKASEIPLSNATYKLTRSHSEKNKATFSSILNETDWTPITSNPNAQEAYSLFHNTLSNAYNKAFPQKKTKIGYDNNLPWLTQGLKNYIKRKHLLHITYLKKPTIENRNTNHLKIN